MQRYDDNLAYEDDTHHHKREGLTNINALVVLSVYQTDADVCIPSNKKRTRYCRMELAGRSYPERSYFGISVFR